MDTTLNMFSLHGRTALVTGGTHGLGLAIAHGMAACGAAVAVCARKQENLTEALTAFKQDGTKVHTILCDVTCEAQVEQMFTTLNGTLGRVDIVVNNAAIIKRIPALEMSVEDWRSVIDIDLTAAFIVSRTAARYMKERCCGKIINMCSMMSEVGRASTSAYAAAKGGLKMLTRALATEWAAYGINVNAIGPGYIATAQTAPLREDGHPFNDFIVKRTPAARWGRVEDVVGGAVFLAGAASDFVNGQVLYIDGGILASLGRASNEG